MKMVVEKSVLEQALEALENCASEHGHRCNRCDSEVDEGGKVVAAIRTAKVQEPAEQQEPGSKMTAGRAMYFMERFKREEKMLGPNEQAALDFVISMLDPARTSVQEPESVQEHGIVACGDSKE